MPEIQPDHRKELTDHSYALWSACGKAMRIFETSSADYKAVARVQAEALAFGRAVGDDRFEMMGPSPAFVTRWNGER